MTFAATANCVLYQGATPVFADVCSDTLNLDPSKSPRNITANTRAILPVDYAGHPADLDAILEIARRHRLIVIEDACHALGAEYRGRRVGSIADMTVFSFHPVKHITTGEGGMVTTDNPKFAETLRRFRNHGISSDARQRQSAGSGTTRWCCWDLTTACPILSARWGLSSWRNWNANLARRREIAARYYGHFGDIPGVIAPPVRGRSQSGVASVSHPA